MVPRAEPPYSQADVAARLAHAGLTLLSMRVGGDGPAGYRSFWPDIAREAAADEFWVPPPSPRQISQMDEALGWISLIPEQDVRLRKVVGARALVSPRTGKPLFSWRLLGARLGCSHVTAEQWWVNGIWMITEALARPCFCGERQFGQLRAAAAEFQRVRRDASRVSARARRAFESA